MVPFLACVAVVAGAALIRSAGGFTIRQTAWVLAAMAASALVGGLVGFVAPVANHHQPDAGSCWNCGTPTQQP